MKSLRYQVPLLVVMLCVGLATTAGADIFLMDYAGYDYSDSSSLGVPNSCYWAVGFVNSVNPTYLTVDYGTNEYTFVLEHTCFVSADTVGSNVFLTYGQANAVFDVYSDPIATGTAADYGVNPPNGSHPTFEDGENILGGDFTSDVTIWIDMNTGNGSISGELEFNRGTQLGNIPVDQRQMVLFIAGMMYMPPAGPEGYIWQLDGQVYIPESTPVEKTTWGRLKQMGGR